MNKKLLVFLSAISALLMLFSACNNGTTTTEQPSAEDSSLSESECASPSASVKPSNPPQSVPATSEEEEQIIYKTVTNPIASSGSDPWVVEHEGIYYYCYSVGNGVGVSSFDSIDQLNTNNGRAVYTSPAGTAYSAEYWAPELHYINGDWYIYVAADDGDNFNHRMYVLKGTTQNPLDPFEMVGKITDSTDKWAIDGTVLQLEEELYFIWSGWEGNENVAQNIYIAHMSDPCTIDSERVLLSAPERNWETVGGSPRVNEGPVALTNGDDVFVVYSASGSWTDSYCLGMLTLTGEDPLNAQHWKKATKPVFRMKGGAAYGPGHCSFAPAADGSIWMIYHANLVSGTGWGGRSVWIAPVTFEEDGTPDFGAPSRLVQFPTIITKK